MEKEVEKEWKNFTDFRKERYFTYQGETIKI